MDKVTIRVVDTMTGEGKPFTDIHDVAQWVAKQMCELTGGVSYGALNVGMWKDDAGQIITEMGMDVITFTDWQDVTVGQLKEIARDLRGFTGQDCVLFTIETMKAVNFI